jgi:uncharacterized protein YggU (UPF0235/DUF167 family)
VIPLRRTGGRLTFAVRVTPRASADAVGGDRDGALLVRVTAPPVEGAANDAVVAVLAKALRIAPGAVRIERGAGARTKLVSVPAEAEAALLRVVK